jgi:hypothetical protein
MKWAIYIATALLMGCASPKNTYSAFPLQHTVLPGETIASIALKYYGQENRLEGASAILAANPEIRDIEMEKGIRPESMVLTIPRLKDK